MGDPPRALHQQQPQHLGNVDLKKSPAPQNPAPAPHSTKPMTNAKQPSPGKQLFGNPEARVTNVVIAGLQPSTPSTESAGQCRGWEVAETTVFSTRVTSFGTIVQMRVKDFSVQEKINGNPHVASVQINSDRLAQNSTMGTQKNVSGNGLVPPAGFSANARNVSRHPQLQGNGELAAIKPDAPRSAVLSQRPRGGSMNSKHHAPHQYAPARNKREEGVGKAPVAHTQPTVYRNELFYTSGDMKAVVRTTRVTSFGTVVQRKSKDVAVRKHSHGYRAAVTEDKGPRGLHQTPQQTVMPANWPLFSKESDNNVRSGQVPCGLPKRNQGNFRRRTVLGLFPEQHPNGKN